jgi:hypothetical protein
MGRNYGVKRDKRKEKRGKGEAIGTEWEANTRNEK